MSKNILYRKTPLMGWASWNCFRTHISEDLLKQQADALVATGLADCGYTYLNTDDGFFGGRDENGRLLFHKERFPNGIKVIADYAHSLGLNAGIYSDGGDNTCGHYYDREGNDGSGVGLYGYEQQDLEMYLEEFGFDFIKVDWCGGVRLGLNEQEQYTKIGNIIDKIRHKTGRQIVYNICRWEFPGEWAADIADSWRTGADIAPNFKSVIHQLDVVKPLVRYTRPGHINDLDMMQIGNGLTYEEEKTHFAMWCMMSTPLMIGCDLTKISNKTLEILKNRELIAINQDCACLQAFVADSINDADGNILGEVWIKDLGAKNSATKAVAFLNRSEEPLKFNVDLSKLGFKGKILSVRNLCDCMDDKLVESVSVAPHGVIVYKITAEGVSPVTDICDTGYVPKPLKKITLQETKELLQNGAILIDTRTAEEYNKAHLDRSINIDNSHIQAISGIIKDKSTPIILYCTTGKRSAQAKRSVDYLGYEKAYWLGGVEI